jgi:hypothetical protein
MTREARKNTNLVENLKEIKQSERNFFLEKGLLSYMFQALIGELVV